MFLRKILTTYKYIAPVLCLIFTLFTTSAAINCFSCESVYDSNCGEDFKQQNYFSLDCSRISPPRYLENDSPSKNSTACIKRNYKENGVKKIVRSCFFGDANDTSLECKMDPMTSATQVTCYICNNENYCNVSTTQISKNGLTIASLLCIILFSKFCFTKQVII